MDFITNLVIGILTGAYSGLIVTRASIFYSLKRQAHMLINNWEYIEDGQVIFERELDTRQFRDIASELLRLGHREAGLALNGLGIEASELQYNAKKNSADYITISEADERFHDIIRSAKPDWKAILLCGSL